MEIWINERRPEVMSLANVVSAVVLHVACFLCFFLFAYVHMKPKEAIIPITLTFSTPAVEVPKSVVEEPRQSSDVSGPLKTTKGQNDVTKAVAIIQKPSRPEGPKKSRAEIERDQIARIRRTARPVEIKAPAPVVSERAVERRMTEAEVCERLGEDEPRHGAQLGTSVMQHCIARIQMAITARWAQVNPRIPADGVVHIAVRFDEVGRMVDCRICKSCGNKVSDDAALKVVRTVGPIAGLDKEFLREFRHQDLIIRYTVQSRP